MKRITILILILLILSGCDRGYESLEEAVQSEWKNPIEVVNQDEERRLVYYLNDDQHILGVYYYENGRYKYDSKHSVGVTFSSEKGLPFFVRANDFEGAGKIIHGAIKTDEHEVEKFIIQYKNGEQQEILAKNNTFITEYPETITTSVEMFQAEIENVIGYDQHGEIVEIYH